MKEISRRNFLKITGMGGISFAAGCTAEPEKTLFSLVRAPDDMVTGKARWYASTCRECPAGCGILAKNREGRIIKLEGNPLHPINLGRLCIRGQAALQGLYHPDRLRSPLIKKQDGWQSISFQKAQDLLKAKAEKAAGKGPNRVRMITEVVGESLMDLFTASLRNWRADAPVVFEPFAYESLRTANQLAFGMDGLPDYKMAEADLLLSFGADFLETWLSPVSYGMQFKAMHAWQGGKKGIFVHVAPFRTLTGANADLWLSCHPGGEAAVVLGLIREALENGAGKQLPETALSAIREITSVYKKEKVATLSGFTIPDFERLASLVQRSRQPLVLGTGACTGTNAPVTDMAVNLLNIVLDPTLDRIDFTRRHRIETAHRRSRIMAFFYDLQKEPADLLLLNQVNPVYAIPPSSGIASVLQNKSLFVVSFGPFMDETAALADLVIPTALPLECWDEYAGTTGILSTLQPAMGKLNASPDIGDLFLQTAFNGRQQKQGYRAYLWNRLMDQHPLWDEREWVTLIQKGGHFPVSTDSGTTRPEIAWDRLLPALEKGPVAAESGLHLIAAPSIRFFDGRGANRPWLCEIPDTLTQVAWQTPLLAHGETLPGRGIKRGDQVVVQSKGASLKAPLYPWDGIRPGVLMMALGQGHDANGRYMKDVGINPVPLLPHETDPLTGAPRYTTEIVDLRKSGKTLQLPLTAGEHSQYGRKIAPTVEPESLRGGASPKDHGLAMWTFPLTPPLPEGYDKARDFYPPHSHDTYRWGMVVDLDRCIGCGACAAACYAENNVGVVGPERIIEGREMAWLQIQRYEDPDDPAGILFLPMLCQHCDNAPCESVCPVYAPHHSKEGINNQIYNRCIGTRFCSQNCPYKVRRFNWFTWQWPRPLHLQLNPDVTVRSKGVMEKCSFCIQRIKAVHTRAKNEKRSIRDGEVIPACVQTCPTNALIFGNLADPQSRVGKRLADPRAYQAMGYLNTKPAVIYLKKVVRET